MVNSTDAGQPAASEHIESVKRDAPTEPVNVKLSLQA